MVPDGAAVILGGALFMIPVVGGVAGLAIGALAKSTEGTGITKEDLAKIRTRWEQALRQAVQRLPQLRFRKATPTEQGPTTERSIELVEGTSADQVAAEISS